MKCIQVNLNGEPLWTIGHEKVDDLVFHLTYAPDSDSVHMSAYGVFSNAVMEDPSSPWEQVFINAGDVVTLQTIESVAPDVTARLLQNSAGTGAGESGLHCSFCGKSQQSVSRLIAGSGVFICNECIEHCVGLMK